VFSIDAAVSAIEGLADVDWIESANASVFSL
jgi:hypothetical protein